MVGYGITFPLQFIIFTQSRIEGGNGGYLGGLSNQKFPPFLTVRPAIPYNHCATWQGGLYSGQL